MSAIGIDLGTSNSSVAAKLGSQIEVIRNAEGQEATPSAVFQRDDGSWIVGTAATELARAAGEWEFLYTSTKRIIGRRSDDPIVQEQARRAPYRITAAADGGAWLQGRKQAHSCEEVSSLILKKLKDAAQKANNGKTIKSAVIAVPAHFVAEQTSRTRDAAAIAGLDVLQMVSEPTAAALAYGMEAEPGQTLAVFDLGAGTFDVSIVQVTKDGIETLATAGDDWLGGDDFDAALVAWVKEQALERGVQNTPMLDLLLRRSCRQIKEELSRDTVRMLNQPHLLGSGREVKHLSVEVTRERLEDLTRGLVERCRAPCERALDRAGLKAEQIGRLLLVGGQTQMPAVDRMARALFPNARPAPGSPQKVVAQGAARLAAALDGGGDLVLRDVTPHAISLEGAEGVTVEMIPAQTRIPHTAKRVCTTVGDDQEAVSIRLRQAGDHKLGMVHLDGLRKRKAGAARVEVEVSIDASALVYVQLTDADTGRKHGQQMRLSGGLDDRALGRLAKLVRKEFVDRAVEVPPEPVAVEEPEPYIVTPAPDPEPTLAPEPAPEPIETQIPPELMLRLITAGAIDDEGNPLRPLTAEEQDEVDAKAVRMAAE